MRYKKDVPIGIILVIMLICIIILGYFGTENVNAANDTYSHSATYGFNEGTGTNVDDAGSGDYDFSFSTEDNDYYYPYWFRESSTEKGVGFVGDNDDSSNMGMHLHSSESTYAFTIGFKITVWIKFDSNAPNYNSIISKFDNNPHYHGYYLEMCGGNQLRFGLAKSDGTLVTVYSDTSVPKDEWLEIMCQHDDLANVINIAYKNVGDVSWDYSNQASFAYTPGSTSESLHVGMVNYNWGVNGGYRPLDGRIDYLKIEWI